VRPEYGPPHATAAGADRRLSVPALAGCDRGELADERDAWERSAAENQVAKLDRVHTSCEIRQERILYWGTTTGKRLDPIEDARVLPPEGNLTAVALSRLPAWMMHHCTWRARHGTGLQTGVHSPQTTDLTAAVKGGDVGPDTARNASRGRCCSVAQSALTCEEGDDLLGEPAHHVLGVGNASE